MSIFKRKSPTEKAPEGYGAEDIKTESSICTGETVIGFYNKNTHKLINAELVRNESDIAAFYEKYGFTRKENCKG